MDGQVQHRVLTNHQFFVFAQKRINGWSAVFTGALARPMPNVFRGQNPSRGKHQRGFFFFSFLLWIFKAVQVSSVKLKFRSPVSACEIEN